MAAMKSERSQEFRMTYQLTLNDILDAQWHTVERIGGIGQKV
jgi:hypothetical protein